MTIVVVKKMWASYNLQQSMDGSSCSVKPKDS